MIGGSVAEDDLSLACQRVGLFLYKFALLEQEINNRIIDILELKGDAAGVVAHSLDFFKKLNILRIVAIERTPEAERHSVEQIFNAIAGQNENRKLMAHCRFEPSETTGSVQFRRTTTHAKVKVEDPLWSPKKFTEEFEKMDVLLAKLNGLKPQLTIRIGEDGTSELVTRYMWTEEGPRSASLLDPRLSLLDPNSSPLHSRFSLLDRSQESPPRKP
jgi:hypothetical protein